LAVAALAEEAVAAVVSAALGAVLSAAAAPAAIGSIFKVNFLK
jgi:hypothetical protein